MNITLDDLAEMTGLSKSTVSRALSGRRRVSPEIAERVREVAGKHGYRPHGVAQALARGRRETYGITWLGELDEGEASGPSEPVRRITLGTEHWQDAHGARNLMLMQWRRGSPEPPKAVRERWVDALMVAYECPAEIESYLLKTGLPGVAVNCAGEHLPSVRVNDTDAAEHAVAYLHDLGHRRIAYVGTPARHNTHPSTRDRLTGYVNACSNFGLAPSGLSTHIEGVQERLDVLLGSRGQPTALLCYSDDVAIHVVHELIRRRIRVPEELSVMGFDDAYVCRVAFVPLTTMRIPFMEMGMRAASLLEELIERPDRDTSDVVLEGELVERASTGPAPAKSWKGTET